MTKSAIFVFRALPHSLALFFAMAQMNFHPACSYNKKILSMVADIVSAHVSRNDVSTVQLPSLIQSVHDALRLLRKEQTVRHAVKREPAVSIDASVGADAITCLECGQQRKMIREHLRREHGLSAEAYRRRWGLPFDYAFTAPTFSNERSALARQIRAARVAVKGSNSMIPDFSQK